MYVKVSLRIIFKFFSQIKDLNNFCKFTLIILECMCNTVRLVGSGVPWEGRLELYVRGQWGTVLYRIYDDRIHYYYNRTTFDPREAQVACHMLGYE